VAEVVIVGAGIGGLATALLLGRQGRRVVVCERDAAPVPGTADEMWSRWQRPGLPQAALGHTFLPGFRALLAERAPDVLERLSAAGAPLVDFSNGMPGDARRPEDAELRAIMCRRPVFDGILRQAVQEERTVELRCGCEVVGLVAEPSTLAGVPRVVGVRTRRHGSIAASSVVVAGGRLVPLRRWFEAIGARPPDESAAGCGYVCFTRYFRVWPRPDENHHVSTQLVHERDLGYMYYSIMGADRSTFCVELIPRVEDHELRELRREAVHMAVARQLPESLDWLNADRATPIGPIAAMGQERNVLRNFVSDGRPIALGLHVIGDPRCQVNSLYAWGSALALAGATTLVDVLGEHDGDPEAQALAFDARVGTEIAGRYAYSCARDRALARAYRGEPKWDDADHGYGFIASTVIPAADDDPDIFRAVMRWELQLDPVGALGENAAVLDRARLLAAGREPMPISESHPTRESVLTTLAASGQRAAPSA
jgi:2-polyprenyl-6-methoxyphenol hydroxylase-like FAD-dependent oxidoreductase